MKNIKITSAYTKATLSEHSSIKEAKEFYGAKLQLNKAVFVPAIGYLIASK